MIILTRIVKKIPWLLAFVLLTALPALAQNINIQGTVVDTDGTPIIGASIVLQDNNAVGSSTDYDGNFAITAPKNSVLVISYIGMKDAQVAVVSPRHISVTLESDATLLEEVIIVGYGQQKKASVVGAITQASSETLQRTVGQTDIGNALTGNLPGVITTTSTGMPGEEEPQIVIRSASSWNSSDPLVLVDGVEREMSSVDMNSVESISVLKDASATAVYGVKGANGVILITTKRGEEGSAKIDVSANYTLKTPSFLPNKYDSYDYFDTRNNAIVNELGISPDSWLAYLPQAEMDKYRNQVTTEDFERYPNVNWQDELFNQFAQSYTANLNVSGGNKLVRYFASADYAHEGDIYKAFDNGRGYETGYSYDRITVRSNLDFTVTPTTTFKMNISGTQGIKKAPYDNSAGNTWEIAQQWNGLYSLEPNVFLPIYSDGSYGYWPENTNTRNPVSTLITKGTGYTTNTKINTDFILEQDLKFITKGLTARGSISWDNEFEEYYRGINDQYNGTLQKWIDPDTGETTWYTSYNPATGFDFVDAAAWEIAGGTMKNWATVRNLNYQFQVNWNRQYGKHEVSAMGLMQRSENAYGSSIPYYSEDWAFRTTYNYDGRYFIEYNGAYNGSEKFASAYRFGFFQSGAIGWMLSEESFVKDNVSWLDMLKLRASYGEVGDDNVNGRWLYLSTWGYGGQTSFYSGQWDGDEFTPYTWYSEDTVGNEDIHWETVTKFNFGIDYSVLDGLLAGSVELFNDDRRDILISGDDLSVPVYFGATPATVNYGRVETSGYEIELRLNKTFKNKLRLWGNFSVTGASNTVLEYSDPELYPDYKKTAGYSIGQTTSYVDAGFCNTYDALYGAPQHDTSNSSKLPGDYYIIDYNCDGIIDTNDNIPYGYTSTPQHTYNATFGVEWKGWSVFAQMYGVTDVSRWVSLNSLIVDTGDVWSINNTDGDVLVPRWLSVTSSYSGGTQSLYDGSYIRLKNIELAYTFNKSQLTKIGFNYLKLYVNGNNVWAWSKMPDDRESNFATSSTLGAYPTMKRYNFGVKFSL